MTPLNIVFFGTSDFGIPSLEALKISHSLVAVVSTEDKPAGRQLRSQPSAVKQWASAAGIPVFDYPKADPSALLPALQAMRPDLFVVISFGALLKSDFLAAPRLYSLNVHASLLPKYRGAAPMQYALLNGDNETGVSVMRMIERLDAGDVLLQKKTVLSADEDLPRLENKLSVLGAQALTEAIGQIEHAQAKFTVQNESQATYTKKITKSDGRIVWTLPTQQLHDRVRAFTGWPGSHFFFQKKRIVVGEARLSAQAADAAPGTVIDISEDRGLLVSAGRGTCLKLTRLQLEGKKMLPWKEFAKGFKLKPGDVLE